MKFSAWIWNKRGFLPGLILFMALGIFVLVTMGEWPGSIAEAASTGKKPRPEDYAKTYVWWAAVVDCGLLLLLGLTARWWARKPKSVPGALPVRESPGWQGLLVVLAILFIAVCWRWPRMDLSLYNDEAHNFVRLVSGDWKPRDADTVGKFRAVKWSETWWLNSSGNNSQPHSVWSRLSHDTWRSLASALPGEVNETALRFPSFLCGMAGIVLLGLAVRSLAGNHAAGWAMAAAALHAWHLRYSTEARGYSMMLLGVCAGWWFLHRAAHSGRWRDWAGYGAGMLVTVWSFPGSVYFLAAQNGMLMVWFAWRWWRGRIELPLLLRPMVTGIVAVMVALPLLLPLLPQLLVTLESGAGIQGTMSPTWQLDMVGYLLTGCRSIDWQVWNPQNVSLFRWSVEMPWTMGLLLTVMLVALVTGSVRLLRHGGVATLLVLAGPLAVEVAWFSMRAKGQMLHHWYALYALPGVLAALAVGIASMRKLQIPVGALALVLPAMIGWQWRQHSKQDERGPVLAVRGAEYPHYRSHQALFAGFWCNSVIYDPRMLVLRSDEEFDALVQRAQQEKRELYVNFSHRDLASHAMPKAVQRLEQSGEFSNAGVFWGQEEPQFTEYLFKLNPPPN